MLNHYGPTETTVGSLTLKLKDYDWRRARLASIPIGRPIQNTQVYVLDANLEPVPVGVTGELYIAGAGVTAGYLGQSEKTSERFIQNPFATDAGSEVGSTMYRTGDLARYGADGNVEFLGRGDDQVKVRGFRIELGEIEAVLARHSGVKQVVVLAREDGQGEKRLLGYVVPSRESSSTGGPVTGEELRVYLKQQLPDYMVPQAVVVLAKLPLNANGKIDRQALPEPEQAQAARAYVAPRTATEETVVAIWAEVLRREPGQISVEDNFFDLGGHSLLATQVISRLRERFSVEIAMRAMFDQPLVSGLAEAVERARTVAAEDEEERMPIARVAREEYRA
jgi:acyl-CoA synthetase (AMP-forming)/AMP-acid ligase II/acyl carrier protein